MSASAVCTHMNLRLVSPGGESFLDSNIRVIRIQFACMACAQRFRAVGVHPGMSIDAPSTLDDGETTVMPIVPVGEQPDMDGWRLAS